MRNKILLCFMVVFMMGCSSDSNESATALNDHIQFLAINAAREGVVVTESGLQYEVIKDSVGSKPSPNDVITVHYIGTLSDDTEFDNSYTRGEPNTFELSGVILGWVEGVQLMSIGSIFRFVVPPELAYGDRGAGAEIGPGAVLIFVIELLELNSA